MKRLIQLKTTPPLLITLALLCFALLPGAQAVVPAPDGGYPGFNTAEGQNALFSLTTGSANTAAGWFALWSNTDGSFNTAVGAGTLLFNIGDQAAFQGIENTAVGAAALLFNTTGLANTATGAAALLNNTFGSANTAIGGSALRANVDGSQNNALGHQALFRNVSGDQNTGIGDQALFNCTGNSNVAVGNDAGSGITSGNNIIAIGAGISGANVSNSCYIGQIFGATSSGGTAVFINSAGRLGTTTSSRRFKEEIKPMERASEALFALKPVIFHYKKGIDPQGIPQFGLVAEEVEAVNPDLVVRDENGEIYTVRYDQVNAMLLNEFLKEHKAFVAEQCKVEKLEATVAGLVATVKEQASQIQKVSSQFEASKGTQQVVNNP